MENLFIINLLIIFICFIFTFYINNRVLLIIILILGHDMIKIENEVITIILNSILGFIISIIMFEIIYAAYRYNQIKKISIFNKIELLFSVIIEELVWRKIVLDSVNSILIYMDIYINYFILAFFITIFFVLAHNKKTIEMFVYSYFLCIGSFILPGINFGLHLGRNLYIYGIYYNDSK